MKTQYSNTRLWTITAKKLRLLAAVDGTTIVEWIDAAATKALKEKNIQVAGESAEDVLMSLEPEPEPEPEPEDTRSVQQQLLDGDLQEEF